MLVGLPEDTGHTESELKASRTVSKTERGVKRESRATTLTRTSPPSTGSRMIWEWVVALLLTLLFLLAWRIRPTGPELQTTWITPATVPPVAA
ncbi:hypothetical protein [Methanopyrus sp.]